MTQTTTPHTPFRIGLPRAETPSRTASEALTMPRRDRHKTLAAWLPRAVLWRGGTPTRDDERALHDLRAAQDRADW